MKNHGLSKSFFVLSILLLSSQAFADEAKKPEDDADSAPPVAKSESGKASNMRKSPRPPTSWCNLHSKLAYMTGRFSGSSRAESFVRDGVRPGASCNYNNNSRLSIGLGMEFYLGKFRLNHAEDLLQASVSFFEFGYKEWLNATLNLQPIKITALFGVESTRSSRPTVNSLQVYLSNDWLDLTDYGSEHSSMEGELVIVEAGLSVEFPIIRNLSLTFGGLWQRYDISLRVNLDAEGRRVLGVLNPDFVSKVDKHFERLRNSFYLTPGLTWQRGGWSIAGRFSWGAVSTKEGTWGIELGVGKRFY